MEAGTARAFSSSGANWTSKYPQIVAAAAQLRCSSAILDGEVYLPDARGAADFSGLPAAIRWRTQDLIFVAFDLLHLDGEDVRSRPVESRRAMLGGLMQSAPAPSLAFSQELGAEGAEAFGAIYAWALRASSRRSAAPATRAARSTPG